MVLMHHFNGYSKFEVEDKHGSHFVPIFNFVSLGTSIKTCKTYKTHVVSKQDTERLSFLGAWK